MKAVGLVTEYNPLHKGHILHLDTSMELSGADVSVAVMSGDFVQRGEPAIIDKYTRTKWAVDCGVNLVVELPVKFALANAEQFATGAVLTLNALGVDAISFGSESGSITDMDYIADILANESDIYQLALKKELKSGASFPLARENAIASMNVMDKELLHSLLASPNNILGIEYLKAIKRHACPITPHTFKREGMRYNETFDDNSKESVYASAEALRHEIRRYCLAMDELASDIGTQDTDNYDAMIFETNDILQNIIKYIPEPSLDSFLNEMDKSMPIYKEDFNSIFNAKLRKILRDCNYNRKEAANVLLKYDGFNENLANRLIKYYDKNYDIDEFINLINDKSSTYTAISRAIFKFILGHKKNTRSEIDGTDIINDSDDDDIDGMLDNFKYGNISYVRILGLDDKGMEYLNTIRKSVPVPIITKTAGFENLLSDDIYASDLYNLAVWNVFEEDVPDEFHKGIYIKGKGFTGDPGEPVSNF